MYDALLYAAGLNVRPLVSKIIILVNCHLTFDRNVYGEMSVILRERDIVLHYLSPTTFQLRNKVMKDLYGFDHLHVYTSKFLSSKVGDKTLRNHMKKPKDLITALAIESGGVTFSQSFLQSVPRTTKAVSSILGSQIASSGVPSKCQVREAVEVEGASP